MANRAGLSLNIGIVGAGIAGLSAAIALSRAGHDVEIFEKSRFASETGAAINVCPNAWRVLNSWGFDFPKGRPCDAQGVQLFGADLSKFHYSSYASFPELYGGKYLLYHRIDLHNGMKELALNPGPDSKPVKTRLSSEVVDVDCERGTLTLADGSVHEKDVVVVADGVHASLVKKVAGTEAPASPTGMAAFRFLIPTETLRQNAETKKFLEAATNGMNAAVSPTGTRLVWYACRNGDVQNLVGIHREKPGRREEEGWNHTASIDDLVDTFQSFAPPIIEVCKHADELRLWKLLFRPPLDRWSRGRAVLVGDAAHPMLPHQGQGGAMAMEDGAALGILFSQIDRKEDIPGRLELFQEVRRNRTSAMQYLSNAGQDEQEKTKEDLRPYIEGPAPVTHDQVHQFNFGHDVLAESQKALRATLSGQIYQQHLRV